MEQNSNDKHFYKNAVRVGSKLAGYLLICSFVLSMMALFFIRRGDMFSLSYIFGVFGIVTNMLFLNSIGTFTINVISILLLTFFIFYFVLKNELKDFSHLKDFVIYVLIIAFSLNFLMSYSPLNQSHGLSANDLDRILS